MSKHSSLPRREFLRRTSNAIIFGGLGIAGPSIFLNRTMAATRENPSEFIRVGFIGVGGQGNHNLGVLMKNAVAVCDVDQARLQTARQRVEKANRRACSAFGDYRKLLEDKSIDAVLISTPDHWHTLVNLAAVAQVWVVSVGLARLVFPVAGFVWHAETVAHVIGVAVPVFTSYLGHKHFSFATKA